jgi:hypothetical protein
MTPAVTIQTDELRISDPDVLAEKKKAGRESPAFLCVRSV